MSNMTSLQLPAEVDQLTLPQKALALGALGVTLWFVLPILITLMVNIYMTLALAVPIAFLAYNYQLIWWVFKTASWKLTQGFIGLDPIGGMERYLEWIEKKHKTIENAKVKLDARLEGLNEKIQKKSESKQKLLRQASAASTEDEATIYAQNALSDQESIQGFIPLRDNVQNKVVLLTELDKLFATNKQLLKHKIENLRELYEATQDTEEGMMAADDVIGGVNYATKMFDESVKQANVQINQMTANIKNIEAKIQPMLNSANIDKQLRQEDARKLLEDFKRTNQLLESGR